MKYSIAIKIFLLIAITSVAKIHSSRGQSRGNASNDERRRLEYLNKLVPNFFLSTASVRTAEWASTKTLAEVVLNGTVTRAHVENLGRSLAKLHQRSRISSLSARQFTKLRNAIRDNGMKDYVSRMVFTAPFASSGLSHLHPSVKEKAERLILNNARVKSEFTRMKALYDTQEECLIGGHLTAEKTKIKDGAAHVVDPQYAGLGPAAFDLASYISYFMMAYYHHMLIPENNDQHQMISWKMVPLTHQFVDAYLYEIQGNRTRTAYEQKLMSETAAFTGILMAGRCLGSPMTPTIDNRPQTAVEALDSAMLLLERSDMLKSIGAILTVGLMLIF